jgi:hypothetical protein
MRSPIGVSSCDPPVIATGEEAREPAPAFPRVGDAVSSAGAISRSSGNSLTAAQARVVVADVAGQCAHGLPQDRGMIHLGSSWIDIGFAGALAEGSF